MFTTCIFCWFSGFLAWLLCGSWWRFVRSCIFDVSTAPLAWIVWYFWDFKLTVVTSEGDLICVDNLLYFLRAKSDLVRSALECRSNHTVGFWVISNLAVHLLLLQGVRLFIFNGHSQVFAVIFICSYPQIGCVFSEFSCIQPYLVKYAFYAAGSVLVLIFLSRLLSVLSA